ncbi:OLC1v1036868C1 [Oldenlandia corymbosa var. corymbosa]|uniref:OLC1v1036868C1 n=1 Tax=Oldenlandia corymbosa var. corymbosa TaxID=529605 RepID=A0AAV1CX34_OLDCO|nr:OLC1v1036868C1 [Oldenlandia corymbosa var. corymbosa]
MSETVGRKLENMLPPLVGEPPVTVVVESPRHSSTHQSIETLVVVLAVITILGVIAGVIARLCGGRHFGGGGEHDIEGWIERKCRSCIDSGIPPPPPPPPPAPPKSAEEKPKTEEAKPAAAEEAKK